MDRQHDVLHTLIIRSYAHIREDHSNQLALRETFASFAAAATEHFAYEASLMERTNFPGSREHMASHHRIALGVMQLMEALDAGRASRRLLDETLILWQVHHVGGMDLALAKHVLAAGELI